MSKTFVRTSRRIRCQARLYEYKFGIIRTRKDLREIIKDSLDLNASFKRVLKAVKEMVEYKKKRKQITHG